VRHLSFKTECTRETKVIDASTKKELAPVQLIDDPHLSCYKLAKILGCNFRSNGPVKFSHTLAIRRDGLGIASHGLFARSQTMLFEVK
jgi:hypothetical protein